MADSYIQVPPQSTGEKLDALARFYESIGAKDEALLRYRMAMWLDRENPEIQERIRALGEIPGPTLAIIPEEAVGG